VLNGWALKCNSHDIENYHYDPIVIALRPGGSWHPEYLTLEHLPLMLQSHEVFARKIGLDMSAAILRAVVDKIRFALLVAG